MQNEWITPTLALQEIDLHIRDLNTRKESIPTQILNQEKAIEAAQTRLKTVKEMLHKNEIDLKNCEQDIAKQDQIVVKMLTNSSMIRKQDEFNAAMEEIQRAKECKSDLETHALELIDEAESLSAQLEEENKNCTAVISDAKDEIDALNAIDGEIEEKLKGIQLKRTACALTVPNEVLGVYERLIKRGKGIPVAQIVGDVCQNCHMKVTQQMKNDVARGDLTHCGNCSCILTLP